MHNFLYYALMFILLWLPFPEGSKPVWAMMIFTMLMFLMAGIATFGYAFGQISLPKAFKKATPVHVGFLIVISWLWFQQLPLPLEWVQALSPKVAELYQQNASLLPGESHCQLASSCHIPLSVDTGATFITALLTTAYFLLFCLILLLVDTRKKLERLLLLIVIAGTFQALFGALGMLSGMDFMFFREPQSHVGAARGTFINRNSFAGFLEMTLAAGIGLLISRLESYTFSNWRERLHAALKMLMSNKLLLRVALAVMVIGLVLSRSRMGNTAFFSSLIITGVLYSILLGRMTKGWMLLFGSLLVIDVMIVSQWFGLEKVIDRIERTSLDTELRPQVSERTLDIIADHWLTGTGGGSYYTALPEYHDGTWRGFFDLAHNDYLQFPAEFGIPVFLVLTFMVLWSLYQAFSSMRLRKDKLAKGAGFASFMGIFAILIHSAVDFNLQIPANAAYFVMLMAVAFLAKCIGFKKTKIKR